MVHSNPLNYAIRDKLALQFKERMLLYTNVNLIIVELVYDNKHYKITDKDNINHVQLRTKLENIMWHKECLMCIGVKRLQQNMPDWKNVCFIDADIHFDNVHWIEDTLKLLTAYDIIQMFSVCLDLDKNGETMTCYHSFGYQYHHHKKIYSSGHTSYSHSGYAWCLSRFVYDKIKYFYDKSINGSGDYFFVLFLINKNPLLQHKGYTKEYIKDVDNYRKNLINFRITYTPGVIRHFYHGTKANRH